MLSATSDATSSPSFTSPGPAPGSIDTSIAADLVSVSSGRQLPKKGPTPAPVPAMYWSQVKTFGVSPKKIRSHTMNVIGDYIYIFGGWDNRACYNEVFVFDSDSMHWSVAKASGDIPPPCRAHSSTVVDRKLYIFGGGDGPNYFNDIYIFDADTLIWTKPKVTGENPGSRRAHSSFAYNGNLYLFGGGDGAKALNDVYILTITPIDSEPSPTHHRPSHSTSSGGGGGSISARNLAHDGTNGTAGTAHLTGTNALTSASATAATYHWSRLETTGEPPAPRGYHTSNLIQDKLLVFGGSDGVTCFADVHILDLTTLTWSTVDCQPPIKRLAHTATQVGSYLFVIAGHDGHHYSNEILLLNLVTMNWETRRVYGAHPPARAYHTTVLHDSRLFLHGGFDGHSLFTDLYVLDLSGYAYLPQVTDFELAMLK
ncbi:hypothetical protein IWQ60_001143 [Tieghemiomyces parasiticus]|uniref:Galactose oxidase n=1 Tax=Tieghemiomyces parasiticus TaxID=78921 RepID=A0A9W8AL44_9FUNG|nr:hypothetical protein IWQ60_001143 [Tieghemiomyces parasiticus]